MAGTVYENENGRLGLPALVLLRTSSASFIVDFSGEIMYTGKNSK